MHGYGRHCSSPFLAQSAQHSSIQWLMAITTAEEKTKHNFSLAIHVLHGSNELFIQT